MKNQNPYKWTYVPRERHKAKECTNCLKVITDQHKCSKDKLLIDEINGNEVFCLPVVQSSFNGWKDSIFKVAFFIIIF